MSSQGRTWLYVGITSFKGKISLTFLFVLLALPAFAAGGACPSNTNYVNLVTGAKTGGTLAGYGITSCYYIAANGSDANDGLSEASGHPWLHAPGMANCAGNCATLQNTGNGVPPGTGLIVRGGDTWHMGNSGASPYTGGVWGFNKAPGPAGTSANPIYVGVDQTWFAGSSWARPILTYDNAPNASQSLGSCAFPTGGNVIDISGGAYYIIDNFEMTGVCTTSANWNVVFMMYGSLTGSVYFNNLYIHGWSHVGFPNPNNCTLNGTCMSAFRGGIQSGHYPPGDSFNYVVVDGSDSDGVPMEFCYCGGWRMAYSYFNNGAQFITQIQNGFHDSTILNFVDNGHANVMESLGDQPGPSNAYAIYNNIFAHLYVSSAVLGNVGFWPARPVGSTLYWFNNLVYDAGPMEFFNVGLTGLDEGTLALFNNTFQFNHRTDGGSDQFGCSASANAAPFTDWNNHYITDDNATVAAMYNAACNGQGTDTTSLRMSNSAATSGGYTSAETYAFSPTSGGSPTVGVGTNKNTFCSALTTASSTDPNLSDAAVACLSDTRFAVSYNTTNHTVSSPGRTVLARPGGAWDVGVYKYGNPPPRPNPPSGLTAVIH